MVCKGNETEGGYIMNKKLETIKYIFFITILILSIISLFSMIAKNHKRTELKKEVISQGQECYILSRSSTFSFLYEKPKGIILKSDTLSSFLEARTDDTFILDSTRTFLCNNAVLGDSISDTNVSFDISFLSFSTLDAVYQCYYYDGIYYALDYVDLD